MTFGEMQRFVYDRLGVAEPELFLQLRTKSLLVAEHRRIAAEHGLTRTTALLSEVAGDPLVTLPTDFVRAYALVRGYAPMYEVTADEFGERTRQQALSGSTATTDGPLYFMFEGPQRIRLVPTPTVSNATGITLWYGYRPVAMTLDADTPDGLYDEWIDYLVEKVVQRMGRIAGRPEVVEDAKAAADELLVRLVDNRERIVKETNRIPLPGYGIR